MSFFKFIGDEKSITFTIFGFIIYFSNLLSPS